MKIKKIVSVLTVSAMIATTLPALISYATVSDNQSSDANYVTQDVISDTTDDDIVTTSSVLPYKDTSLSFEERAADLVSRMTLEEKVSQTGRSAPAISRLGVSAYNYWREGIHGVARQGKATSFPSSLAMSNTWDRQLMYDASTITSIEARGKNNRYDLSYWNPTINMARDPRWGRNEETYGEDPYLTAEIGGASVSGMQGDDEKYVRTIATLKHFAANNCEGERQTGTSVMNESTLREYYTRAFRDIVQNNNPLSVMSSYNALTISRNGNVFSDYIASSANKYLLTDLLRTTWGFSGYVVGDCGAWENLYGRQTMRKKLFPELSLDAITAPMVVSKAYQAGNNLDCGARAQSSTYDSVIEGWMTEQQLDLAVYDLFYARMKTGEFDAGAKYQDISSSVIETDANVAKAEEAAENSWVLLENKENTLPIKSETQNIAVVGGLATEVTLGDYSGEPSKTTTPYQGIVKEMTKINPDTKVNMIGNVNDSTPLFNIKSITLVKTDGTKKVVDLSKAESVRGMTLSGSSLVDVTKSGMAVVKNIDFSNVASVRVDAASMPGMPKTSVNIGYSNSTQMVSSIDIQNTDSSDTYKTNEAAYTGADGGYNGTADMYINISASSDFSVENYKTSLDAADYIIAYGGTTTADSKESNDRASIDMPISQAHVQKICDAYPDKTIVVLSTVGQINAEPFKDKCKAILWTSYNGQTQGTALGKVLTGQVNPSGKLTTTWYKRSDLDLMPIGSPKEKIDGIDYNFTDYGIAQKNNYPGRTYQYYSGTPIYPFGYGQSYTSFEYSNIKTDKSSVDANGTVKVSVDITNTGSVDGSEVAQLYVSVPGGDGTKLPLKQLKGFEKKFIKAGETITVTFDLNIADVYFFNEETQENYVVNGDYTIKVGANSNDANGQATTVNVSGSLADTVNRVSVSPSGLTVIGAKEAGNSTIYPANTVTAGTIVSLNNEKLISDLSTLSNADVKYTSSNENVAKVDADGNVQINNIEGTATITVTVTQNSKAYTGSFPVVSVIKEKVAQSEKEKYLNMLNLEFNKYNEAAYTAENWAKMQNIYNAGVTNITNELLEENLEGIYSEAVKSFKDVPSIELTDKYIIKSENPNIIVNNMINYNKDGIGEYSATSSSISGTITVNSPCSISLQAFDGDNSVDKSKLSWTIQNLSTSKRAEATVTKDGILNIFENGVFKLTASNYEDKEFGGIVVYANLQVEAESADSDVTVSQEIAGASNEKYASSTGTRWIRFDGVKLKGLKSIDARVSQSGSASKLNVSLGSNSDRIIASTDIQTSTGWEDVSADVNKYEVNKLNLDENGCGTIYVQVGGADLDFIKLNYIDANYDVTNEPLGKIRVTVPYESGIVVAAKYNDDGTLNTMNDQEITQAGDYVFDGFEEDDKVTFYVWDNFNNAQPLDNAVENIYKKPEARTMTLYRFDDTAFDSFFETADGDKLVSGTGMNGTGGWATEAKDRSYTYDGKSYTFKRGLKGGRGGTDVKNVYFTPDADGAITVLFDSSSDRYIEVMQDGKVLKQQYGTASGKLTPLEVMVKAGVPVYIYGGGANKSIFAVFFDTEKTVTESSPSPSPTATAEPEPTPVITYTRKTEFEDFNNSWCTGMTKTSEASASNGFVIDNTRNNDTFYFGEYDLNDLAVIELIAGTKETGVVTVEFFAVDVNGVDIGGLTQSSALALLTSDKSIGKTVLNPSTTSWNDFKTNVALIKTAQSGTKGIFAKCTTTGKYCGNFDYMNFMYSDPNIK